MNPIKNIKNRLAIITDLADLLMGFDKDMSNYQTDVYLYIDKASGYAYLEPFVNVGGTSWLNDDHITIYSDKPHEEDVLDRFETINDIAEAIGINVTDFIVLVKQFLYDCGSIEEMGSYVVDRKDCVDYAENDYDVYKKLTEFVEDEIESRTDEYLEKAISIIKKIEEEYDMKAHLNAIYGRGV